MTLSLRIPGFSYTDTTIPIIYNDAVANAGTVGIFDALDADVSWVEQSDPAEGVDTWKSLVGADTAAFAGTVGWSDGFTIDATADQVQMPASFKTPLGTKSVHIWWVKVGTQAFTSGSNNYIYRSGSLGTNQFINYINYGATEAASTINMYAANNASQILAATVADTLIPGTRVYQMAMEQEVVGGFLRNRAYRNGQFIGEFTSGSLTAIPQPGANPFFGGASSAFTGTVLRSLMDDLTVTTAAELVLLDYNTHVARLTA